MKVRVPWIPSKSQKERMQQTIKKRFIEADKRQHLDTEALVLWALHVHTGKGKKALKNFYETYDEIYQTLIEHYALETNDDVIWFAHYKLKEIGVDVKEWHEEMEQRRKQR